MSGYRLAQGGLIDRSTRVPFHWDGRALEGFAGDTLASALLANGIVRVGRSFKYHRARGLLGAGLEEPNAIIQLEEGAATTPNVKATQVPLYSGLRAKPVNAWPNVDFDAMAINGLFKRFIPAGFYYKTFTWPHWLIFEPSIRAAAGLGRAPTEPDPARYEHRFAHTDTLIIGAGAAGLAAAQACAEAGLDTLLVDSDFRFGGGLLGSPAMIEGLHASAWVDQTLNRLAGSRHVTLLKRTLAFGYYDHNLIGLCQRLDDHLPHAERNHVRERLWKVRARRVILATGAFERPLAFENNDLPGVMLASAAQTYALRFGAAPGRTVVFATNNDSAYDAAAALHDAGVAIAAILDSRGETPAAAAAQSRGIRVIWESLPCSALSDGAGVRGLKLSTPSGKQTIACDAVLVSGGWNPAVHLHSQSAGALRFDDSAQTFLPDQNPQRALSVGAAAGHFDLIAAVALAEQAIAGATLPAPAPEPVGPTREYQDGDSAAHKAFVDFQNDVTVGDLHLAARENFRSIEHVKRYTTLGMASDQGKTSNVAAIQHLSKLLDRKPQTIGTTRFRPPFDPVTIGAFAGHMVGHRLSPIRVLPAHERHLALGAVMADYGPWLRPAAYPRPGEDEHAAVIREVRATRTAAGLFDASPLGKIEVKGRDAAEFLNRMYVNSLKALKLGACRYALMLSELGFVFDDGVIARLAEDHFLVGATSGHASAVAAGFQEWLQGEWPDLDVVTEDVTTAWAVMNVVGPKSREILAKLEIDIDLSREAFPHMTLRLGRIGDIPVRIQRVSFTGELSYEVAAPSGYGAALWDSLMRLGASEGLTPFGIEALTCMRIEKGYLHIGADTDGATLPQDIGFAELIAKKKDDFIGRRSTLLPDGMRSDRRQIVGLEANDSAAPLSIGAHIGASSEKQSSDGWVTSSTFSPTLNRPLAMALLSGGRARLGESVRIYDLGQWRSARVVAPGWYDPEGLRLDV